MPVPMPGASTGMLPSAHAIENGNEEGRRQKNDELMEAVSLSR